MKTIVRVTSHRARQKLQRLVGRTQGYFSWDRDGSWYECPPDKLEQALTIKGIRRAKWKDDLRPYIKWNDVEECGCCGAFHRKGFDGDCRDDDERFPDIRDEP
jgi:hypothetical protein